MEYQFYKQLRSGNEYSPLGTPCLTTAAAFYHSKTAFHRYQKSAAFGYPALQYHLNISQEKLTTLQRPYKPASVMPPHCPTNFWISTTAEDLEIVHAVETMEGACALARLRDERDVVFGNTCPPCDINMLTYAEVRGLADETPRTYGEINWHVKNWQRTQPRVEFCDGETFTHEAIYYQGPSSPPYIPETTPSLTAAAAARIQEVLWSLPPTDDNSESSERPSDPNELVEYYLDKHRKAEALQIEAPPAINPEDFWVKFPKEEPAPNDPGQDMSPVQLAAPLPETDIYGDPVKETEVTERAHSPEPLPTPPPINNH